jgi:hypothetical protein
MWESQPSKALRASPGLYRVSFNLLPTNLQRVKGECYGVIRAGVYCVCAVGEFSGSFEVDKVRKV